VTIRILNIAIVFVALVLGGLLVRKFFFQPSSPNYRLTTNAALRIDGINWADSERTVLLALSKECKYCAASAEFYRRLAAGLERQKTRLVAVFSEKESDGEAYLKRLEVPVREVRYASFSSLGINSVPTLALVDRNGVVTYMWVGKLPPLEEKGLMSKLGLEDIRSPDEWSMTEARVERKLANKEQLLLLDVRERESFTTRHRDGARNIPLDELPVRAQNELSPDQTIVIYSNDASEMDLAYSILETQGFAHILLLVPDAPPFQRVPMN